MRLLVITSKKWLLHGRCYLMSMTLTLTSTSFLSKENSGVKSVDINLENQVVRILWSTTVKDLTVTLAESGSNVLSVKGSQKAKLGVALSRLSIKEKDMGYYEGKDKEVRNYMLSLQTGASSHIRRTNIVEHFLVQCCPSRQNLAIFS